MKNIYSTNITLNLFELDELLSLIEEKKILKEEDEIICNKIYTKLEDAISSICFKEEPEKILKKQKEDYIKK